MKLMIQSAMIFFGTLMAAAMVALGEPASAEQAAVQAAQPSHQATPRNAQAQPRHDRHEPAPVAMRVDFH